MLKHDLAILGMNLEQSMCVRIKCNTVLPGKAYWYITVILLVYILRTPTCYENARVQKFVLR